MKAVEFCGVLKQRGFTFFVGVPDTILKSMTDFLSADSELRYVSAVREEEAIGIATGAYLGGQRSAVLMQNSGLGNSMGALATLPLLYRIPLLLLVSWRGYRGKDAPEHSLIGKHTVNLLKNFEIATETLTNRNWEEATARAIDFLEKKQIPAAILIREGAIS